MSIELLEERVEALKVELRSYGKEINGQITALYSNPKSRASLDLKNDPSTALRILRHDVSEILQISKNHSENNHNNQSEIEECSRLIGICEIVSTITSTLMECEQAVNKSALSLSCKLLKEIELELLKLPGPNSEMGGGKVCAMLRKESRQLRSRLLSKVRRMLVTCVQFQNGKIVVMKKFLQSNEGSQVLQSNLPDNEQRYHYASVTDTVCAPSTTLSDVWAAAMWLEKGEESIDKILAALWCNILNPLWKEKKITSPYTSLGEERSEFIIESIVGDASSGDIDTSTRKYIELKSAKMPLPQLLECLTQVFDFVWKEIFAGHGEVAQCAAMKLRASNGPYSLSHLLVETVAAGIPKTEGELTAFRKSLERPVRSLETQLLQHGLILPFSGDDKTAEDTNNSLSSLSTIPSASETNSNHTSSSLTISGPLSALLNPSTLGARYATQRRREILERGREVVLADYHNTMLAAGDATEDELSSAGDVGDPRALLDQSGSFALQKLKFDSCQISLAACRLLKLVHEVLKLACDTSSRVTNILFQTARDCVEIFMAIVPLRFADSIDMIPRMGAIFYNDCLYISHNCTLLTHKYRQALGQVDETFLQTAGFADFIPRLRQLGDQCISRHIEEQRTMLSELTHKIHLNPIAERSSSKSTGNNSRNSHAVSSQDTMTHNTDEEVFNDEDSAGLVVRHLGRLSTQWQGVLQESVYHRLMGYLLEHVLREVVRPVLDAACIAESAGTDISRVYRTLQKSRMIFPAESELGNDDEALSSVCPTWTKFLALTDLLDYSLSEVAEWLPRKKFSNFTVGEMTSLLRALFEDTPRRQAMLDSILEMAS